MQILPRRPHWLALILASWLGWASLNTSAQTPTPAQPSTANPLRPEWVGVHVASWHSRPGMQNFNPGVYAIWPNRWIAGAFYNSEARPSVYVGKNFSLIGPLEITVGGILGYEIGPIPLLLPSMALRISDNTKARLVFIPIPGMQKKGSVALHFGLEWSL